ncbi:hypothetical protein [Nevskia sp.]|uniref:hypothetical protein n=1 Tax=Nevskia sp. TaxID=1929292 RepID=UPI003F718793
MTEGLRAPTVGDLITAFEDAIKDKAAAGLLSTNPADFAKARGWTFAGDKDPRINKFKSVEPEAFGPVEDLLKLTPAGKQVEVVELIAKSLCAATRIVRWSGASKDDLAPLC